MRWHSLVATIFSLLQKAQVSLDYPTNSFGLNNIVHLLLKMLMQQCDNIGS